MTNGVGAFHACHNTATSNTWVFRWAVYGHTAFFLFGQWVKNIVDVITDIGRDNRNQPGGSLNLFSNIRIVTALVAAISPESSQCQDAIYIQYDVQDQDIWWGQIKGDEDSMRWNATLQFLSLLVYVNGPASV